MFQPAKVLKKMYMCKKSLQNADFVLHEFPRGCIFLKKVSSREDCAERMVH